MSRRRYISTDISIDRAMRQVSDAAALFYTWMIPHVADDATITSDPDELASIVVPNRKNWSTARVSLVIEELQQNGLFVAVNGTIYLPPRSFYKYQSSIPEQKRRAEQPEENSCSEPFQKKILKPAKNSASPSPSPSPSKHLSDKSDGFERFYSLYPRKVGRGAALKAWNSALKRATAEEIIAGLERLRPAMLKREVQFIPHPSTWLNADSWLDEQQESTTVPEEVLRERRERIRKARDWLNMGEEQQARAWVRSDEEWQEALGGVG